MAVMPTNDHLKFSVLGKPYVLAETTAVATPSRTTDAAVPQPEPVAQAPALSDVELRLEALKMAVALQPKSQEKVVYYANVLMMAEHFHEYLKTGKI